MVAVADLDNLALVNLEGVGESVAVPCTRATHCSTSKNGSFFVTATTGVSTTRNDVVDYVLLHVVAFGTARASDAAGVWVHHCELEVAIAKATPSPVNVEIVAIFVAVAHE